LRQEVVITIRFTHTLVTLRAQIIPDHAARWRKEQNTGFGEVKANRLLASSVAFDANALWFGDKVIPAPTLLVRRYKDIFMSQIADS
jgi:hypothetical protein